MIKIKNKYDNRVFYNVFINAPPRGYAISLLKTRTGRNTSFQIAKEEN